MKIDNKVYWIVWKTACPITKKVPEDRYSSVLLGFEKNIMPKLKDHLDLFLLFQTEDFLKKYEFSVIRRLQILEEN
jgi:hypothetical protein